MMNPKQQIVEQDNEQLRRLIEAVEEAEKAHSSAALAYELSRDSSAYGDEEEAAQRREAAAEALDEARIRLCLQVETFWNAGYRLCRDDG